MMENHVKIHSLRLFARHGVLPQEQVVGAWFMIDVDLTLSFVQAMLTDDLDGTVSYAEVYDVIRTEFQKPCKLIEYVGGRIVCALFNRFRQVSHICLELTKETPPVSGLQCSGCSIVIDLSREDCENIFGSLLEL